eukprot:221808-Chlamydomonas_euryale.AAC.1
MHPGRRLPRLQRSQLVPVVLLDDREEFEDVLVRHCRGRNGDALHKGSNRGSSGRRGKQAGPHRPAARAMPLAGGGRRLRLRM